MSSSPDGTEPAEEQLAELADRWRRAAADADDLRKRFERRLAEQSRAERARTVLAFLPVLDDLELALRHAASDPAVLARRVRAAHEQAVQVLAGLGFSRIDGVGGPFDPARHVASQDGHAAHAVHDGHATGSSHDGHAARATHDGHAALATRDGHATRATHDGNAAGSTHDGHTVGTVMSVLRPGYTDRHGTLLRPATVVVARDD